MDALLLFSILSSPPLSLKVVIAIHALSPFHVKVLRRYCCTILGSNFDNRLQPMRSGTIVNDSVGTKMIAYLGLERVGPVN